jgi:hypothetical protein
MKYKFNLKEFMIGFSFSWILLEIFRKLFNL